jgi:hypothetical protein
MFEFCVVFEWGVGFDAFFGLALDWVFDFVFDLEIVIWSILFHCASASGASGQRGTTPRGIKAGLVPFDDTRRISGAGRPATPRGRAPSV